ncbi:meprin A subunit beta-like [Protopterus annectens]|uniref:meprin A subunit beta-like n=1 Tax=Protopterus annectens TaxID=7888 RepID=UPI001CFB73A1|nr:meprin A subunit beta-like [Protopterus annectens]
MKQQNLKLPSASAFPKLNAKALILQAFEHYRLKTCIDFKQRTNEENYISVYKGSGCSSKVGNRQMGQQSLSIGSGCDRLATIEHEFFHALGFWHEQSRADRDDYVTIMWDNIESGHSHNFNKYDDSTSDSLNVPYDYTSVMHYSKTSFSVGSSKPTIVTNIPAFNNVIGQRMDFSDYDLLKLNRLYNCTRSLSFMEQCSFDEENICGMIQRTDDGDDWQRVSQAKGGPSTDHTVMSSCKDSGYFMYFSTASGSTGKTGFLESRLLYPKRGFQCLQFYYYNSGNENDELNVWVREYTSDNSEGKLQHIGKIKGKALGYWQLQHFSFNIKNKFRVVFEGVKGTGPSSGGFSIDDVNLSETRCPTDVWHIRNFAELLASMPPGTSGRIYSPRFYSSEGYGFQISLYVNGKSDNPGNLAIYVHLTSGIYDNQLQWPCPWRQVSMTLMDQHPDIRRRMSNQRSITTDPTETTTSGGIEYYFWDRPDKIGSAVTDSDGTTFYRGPGKGTSTFISHERLKSREFIKGDDIFILLTMQGHCSDGAVLSKNGFDYAQLVCMHSGSTQIGPPT